MHPGRIRAGISPPITECHLCNRLRAGCTSKNDPSDPVFSIKQLEMPANIAHICTRTLEWGTHNNANVNNVLTNANQRHTQVNCQLNTQGICTLPCEFCPFCVVLLSGSPEQLLTVRIIIRILEQATLTEPLWKRWPFTCSGWEAKVNKRHSFLIFYRTDENENYTQERKCHWSVVSCRFLGGWKYTCALYFRA